MTGFGGATATLPDRKITIEIKSLNSKQFDLNCRIAPALRPLELKLRSMAAASMERGKTDLSVNVEYVGQGTPTRINTAAIAAYKSQIENMHREFDLPEPADWYSLLLRLPDVLTGEDDDITPAMDREVTATMAAALEALRDYRRAEGIKLESFFKQRLDGIRRLLASIEPYEAQRIEAVKKRLEEGLAKLANIDHDKGRLEQELFFYIEKLDINEEKQRLTQHLDYFEQTMASQAGGQGKKLGFIAQEMGREINTLGSKSNHALMQQTVVQMKDLLEQIKEQVLNVL